MAHGNQLRSTLHTHDTCHTGHTKLHHLFFTFPLFTAAMISGLYLNGTRGYCCTVSDRFVGHIHHNSISIFIKMIQFHICLYLADLSACRHLFLRYHQGKISVCILCTEDHTLAEDSGKLGRFQVCNDHNLFAHHFLC